MINSDHMAFGDGLRKMIGTAKNLVGGGTARAAAGAASAESKAMRAGRSVVKSNPIGGYAADALGPKPTTFAGYQSKKPLKTV